MPATRGAAALVPPNTNQPERVLTTGPYTATPVAGSATADVSASTRGMNDTPFTVMAEQGFTICHTGLAKMALQPLPAPDQAVSDQPLPLFIRLVPPTAMTLGTEAGNDTP